MGVRESKYFDFLKFRGVEEEAWWCFLVDFQNGFFKYGMCVFQKEISNFRNVLN